MSLTSPIAALRATLSEANANTLRILLFASLVAFLTPFILSAVLFLYRSSSYLKPKNAGVKRVIWVSAFLFVSIFLLRYSVALFGIYAPVEGAPPELSAFEELANCMLHTLQTFSLDEDYTMYFVIGKELVGTVFGEGFLAFYAAFASILNVAAPITGGALIFEVLANIFPKLSLFGQYLLFWKKKYYFSELNKVSLALAKSIRESEEPKLATDEDAGFLRLTLAKLAVRFKRIPRKAVASVLIFTDVYADTDNEINTEIINEAKRLGAICLRDDLSHIPIYSPGKKKFFLTEVSEAANFHSLVDLVKERKCDYLIGKGIDLQKEEEKIKKIYDADKSPERDNRKLELERKLERKVDRRRKAEIYLFCDSDNYTLVERQFKEYIKAKKPKCQAADLPALIPVQRFRNLISNMLTELPLYEPITEEMKAIQAEMKLTGKKPEKKIPLSVSIIGMGEIGREMFLSVYWFSQMLHTTVTVNIFSKEESDVFWSKMDILNPEIRRTVEIIASDKDKSGKEMCESASMSNADDDILSYGKEKNPPYCRVKYHTCDVNSTEFSNMLSTKPEDNEDKMCNLLYSHYILVCLGSDEGNINIANLLRTRLGSYHLADESSHRAIINYIVYDSDLSDVLNKECNYKIQSYDKKTTYSHIYLRAVGCFRELYSVKNIFMPSYEEVLKQHHRTYISHTAGAASYQRRAKEQIGRAQSYGKDYVFWANLTRVMHLKYKMFSVGMVKQSIFDGKLSTEILQADFDKFEEFCTNPENKSVTHELAWLEHRRWNAFTRIKGHRGTKDYKKYYGFTVEGDKKTNQVYKHQDLKLHPCLLECDDRGMMLKYKDGKISGESLLENQDFDELDKLDLLTYDLLHFGVIDYDFKESDYPSKDISDWKKAKRLYGIGGKKGSGNNGNGKK